MTNDLNIAPLPADQLIDHLTIEALLGIHNGLNPDKSLKSWKRSKKALIERIEILRAEQPEPEVTEETEAPERTIREAAIELLCAVDHHEDRDDTDSVVDADHPDARSVGIAYDEIIRRIKKEFPECQTSVACLRWYSVKIRVEEQGYEGLRLAQRRPRVRPAKRG